MDRRPRLPFTRTAAHLEESRFTETIVAGSAQAIVPLAVAISRKEDSCNLRLMALTFAFEGTTPGGRSPSDLQATQNSPAGTSICQPQRCFSLFGEAQLRAFLAQGGSRRH